MILCYCWSVVFSLRILTHTEKKIMIEDVQGLLEKIHNEGISKAQEEKQAVLAQAKREAESIIAAAREEADGILNEAQRSIASDRKKADDAIRQAARDIVISMKADLLKKLNAVTRECIAESMTAETMEKIILEMAKNYNNASGGVSAEILLAQKDQELAQSYLMGRLLEALKQKPEIRLTNDFNSGLQISFKGDEVFFDFSDEALTEVLCKFTGAKLAAVIKG